MGIRGKLGLAVITAGKLGLAVITAGVVVSAVGCASSATPTPKHTTTVTVPASPTPSPSTPVIIPGPTAAKTAAPATECSTASLTGSLGQSAGAAGTDTVPIILTNRGSVSCTLQGWPGVSAVAGGNGTQIGPAATLDRSTPHTTVTLAPGAAAQATLTSRASNAPNCDAKPADGLRVYPPGQKASLFIAYKNASACSVTSRCVVEFLDTVRSVRFDYAVVSSGRTTTSSTVLVPTLSPA